MPPGIARVQFSGRRDINSSWSLQGAEAPSAMPLNKAASGPKMNGYHGEGSTGAVHGPMGRNDGVLYGRMPGGENVTHSSMWSGQGQVNMRGGGIPPSFLPQGSDGLVEGMDALQLGGVGGEGGMRAAQQRHKVVDGERQEETDDDMFAMFRFKVVPCSKQFVHDWKECSFAHEGETARRRHPSLHTATPCPDFKSTKSCPRGDKCTMAHGPWEAGLHPDAFKTNLCAYGKGCQRRMCFFAHDGCELRSPQPGASQQLMQQPAMQQHAGMQGNSWNQGHQHQQQQQHHQQQQQQGPARNMPFTNAPGAAQKGGIANQRGRSTMNMGQGPKNGMVPGPQDPNLPMGFEDMSAPADRKAAQVGGMGPKAWAPAAQGPGPVGGMGSVLPGDVSGGQANQRQAGRGLNSNKGLPTAGPAAPGTPNAMRPGAKPNNPRRTNSNAMRGAAAFNGARMGGAQNAGAPSTPGEDVLGEDDDGLKVNVTPNGTQVDNSITLNKGVSPEWVKQEDTSWVDKLLDSPFDAM